MKISESDTYASLVVGNRVIAQSVILDFPHWQNTDSVHKSRIFLRYFNEKWFLSVSLSTSRDCQQIVLMFCFCTFHIKDRINRIKHWYIHFSAAMSGIISSILWNNSHCTLYVIICFISGYKIYPRWFSCFFSSFG